MKKTALYIRVSTEAQAEEGYSIDAQQEKLSAYCKVKDIKGCEFYIDGGFSGSNLSRPRMQDLIKSVQKGQIAAVIVYKLDRLSRSQKDTLYLIEDVFLPHGVDFVSINENIDTSSPYGRAMIGIMSAFAQLERENIYMRTRMGMVERVKNGYWMGGGTTPFGYDYDQEQGILVPNEEAEKVRQIYDLYIRGYSPSRIAIMLDLKYEKIVVQILCRKSNAGYIEYKGEEYIGRHEPLVPLEVYNLAMQKMKERQVVRAAPPKYLLTGLVYCGYCGAKMRYQKWNRKTGQAKLVCYSKNKDKPYMVKDAHCPASHVWANRVEQAVVNDLFRLSANLSEGDLIQDGILSDPVKILEARVNGLKAKIKRLYNLFAEGNDMLMETISDNEAQLREAQAQLEQERKHQVLEGQMVRRREKLLDIRSAWAYMTPEEKQCIVRDCVSRIEVQDDRVDIHYRFETAQAGQESA